MVVFLGKVASLLNLMKRVSSPKMEAFMSLDFQQKIVSFGQQAVNLCLISEYFRTSRFLGDS